jgi:AAA+ ATPase superfamily predicted ATPase
MNKITNPFVTGGYAGPEYFCDRQDEVKQLLQAISSKRNVTLISLRRMGKTGLLKHTKHLLEQTKKPAAIAYIDLMPTMNGNEMLNVLSTALLRLKRNEKNFFERIMSVLSTLRPGITYDSLTGQPSLTLKIETPEDIQMGLDNLMHFIKEIKQDLVFMLDEFQQISRYPEKNMEQLLRSIVQSHPTIPFIFSGSSKHMLEPMFSAANRLFYQSAELMYLTTIPDSDYRSFILEKFQTSGKEINDDVLSRIFNWTRLHTFYVQYVCNLLFESEGKILDNDQVSRAFHHFLTSYEPLFASYRNLIPPHQFRLLQAIAIEDGVAQPTSGTFINKHSLTSASSVSTSLKALAEKEMIVHEGNRWLVYDVFFARWLEYHYG